MQVVDSVVQALVVNDALEATLATASAELVASVLHHVRRQLSRPRHACAAIALADCLLSSCPVALGEEGQVQELQKLRAAVTEELRTQEQLMLLQGTVGAVLCAT